MSSIQQTSCDCGNSQVAVTGKPLMRFICHCKICQAVYQAPYADILVFKSKQLITPLAASVSFAAYRRPPAISRGICSDCKRPVVAKLALTPFSGLSFIPASNFSAPETLAQPRLQTFYHRCISDPDIECPTVRGYWRSQLALITALAKSLRSAS